MESITDNRIKQIDVIFNEVDYIYHKIAVNVGLTDTSFKILRALLMLKEGCTQTDIYRSICLNKQTVNSSIKQLIENEIIYFQQGKGREIKIYLTKKGKDIIEKKIKPIVKIENEILEKLTNEEYQLFIDIANKYIIHLTEKIDGMEVE